MYVTVGSVDLADIERHQSVLAGVKEIGTGVLKAKVKKKVVLVEFPMYRNIGDLLIHTGTERWFSDNGISVVDRFSLDDLGRYDHATGEFKLGRSIESLDEAVGKSEQVVFQGGGNFGDIWPQPQKLREALVKRYRNKSFVLMPQSMHFASKDSYEAARRAFAQRADIHLFVRDSSSLRIAAGLGPSSLAPDMAHQLWPDLRTKAKRHGALVQARRDVESKVEDSNVASFDWDDLIGPHERLGLRALTFSKRMSLAPGMRRSNYRMWMKLRDIWIQRAIKTLASVERFHTDRLHGMILAALLETPTMVNDNSYGKVFSYYREWLEGSPIVNVHPA